MDKGGAQAERGYPGPTRGVAATKQRVSDVHNYCIAVIRGLSHGHM